PLPLPPPARTAPQGCDCLCPRISIGTSALGHVRMGHVRMGDALARVADCGLHRGLPRCGVDRPGAQCISRPCMAVGAAGPSSREARMPIVRNIDVTMQSEVSFDEACRAAVAEAAKTLRGIMSFRVNETEC